MKKYLYRMLSICLLITGLTGCEYGNTNADRSPEQASSIVSEPVSRQMEESSSPLKSDLPDLKIGVDKYYCISEDTWPYQTQVRSIIVDQNGKEVMRYTGAADRPGENPVSPGKAAEKLSLVRDAFTLKPSYISLHTDTEDSLYDLHGTLLQSVTGSDSGYAYNEDYGYTFSVGDWVQRMNGNRTEIVHAKTGERLLETTDLKFPSIAISAESKCRIPPLYIPLTNLEQELCGVMDQRGNIVPQSEEWEGFYDTTVEGGHWFIIQSGQQWCITDTNFQVLYPFSDDKITYLQRDYFRFSDPMYEERTEKVVSLETGDILLVFDGIINYFDGEIAINMYADGRNELIDVNSGVPLFHAPPEASYIQISPSDGNRKGKAESFCANISYPDKPTEILVFDREGKTLWEGNADKNFDLGYGLWAVQDTKTGQVEKVINATGEEVITVSTYQSISRYRDLYLSAALPDGSCSIYDLSGKLLFTSEWGGVRYGDRERLILSKADAQNRQLFTMTDLAGRVICQFP